MTIQRDIQLYAMGNLVTLFSIDLRSIIGNDGLAGGEYLFYPSTKEGAQPIMWQGKAYSPWPVEATGFDKNVQGTYARPHLKVGNVLRLMTEAAAVYDDLVGATVTRKRTFSRFLDGQPDADPNQAFPDDVYFVEKKVMELPEYVEWELASALDIQGVQLPARQILASYCPWVYRSAECGYTGTNYFDSADQATTQAHDVCGKRLGSCERRFGQTAELPFGGFPGARMYGQ